MVYALNDLLASFVFIDCIIVWKCMLKCVLRVRIKLYIYIYIYSQLRRGRVLYIVITISNTVVYIYLIKRIYKNHELHLCVDRGKEMSNPPLSCDLVPKWKVVFGCLGCSTKFCEVQR